MLKIMTHPITMRVIPAALYELDCIKEISSGNSSSLLSLHLEKSSGSSMSSVRAFPRIAFGWAQLYKIK